ncbi:4-alpha-glucanotransferase [Desulfuromonas sp. AOP6]|uniref:4-alpha-glucanotransferase n=1 Tax=Desulfuromonas sp. AOP6 TaxID=1566351 RepID=UPI001288AE29|nr:4-alpha-glucanotransferase [Desulfuromonas sp. AOP6]BCA80355.1 4-alpha-glucanotransferase [Desulfuromonas sp. AOP6]
MLTHRASGILLHPTSLPGRFGLGSLGKEARRFIDFLADSQQSVWQILPLGPTGYGDSPYNALSAFAGNPLLVDLEDLVVNGDLDAADLKGIDFEEGTAHFSQAHLVKDRLLRKGATTFFRQGATNRASAFARFTEEQGYWLHDYALFKALRNHFSGQSWSQWPEALRRRQPQALQSWGEDLAEPILFEKYAQFVFFEQWFSLKAHAHGRGVRIMGDIPIFVAFDSADVWANPHLFYLDENQNPTLVAGVPPDYFSTTGQRWGNPLYNWERLEEQDFSWWLARFRWNLALTDLVRIDHFRGFESYWAIPATEKTAVGGHWRPAAGRKLFQTLQAALGSLPLIAEDLGVITPEVEALRDDFAFPGMKILQFAFGSGPRNPYLPHNLTRNCVIYTGTHDNNTTLGWWKALAAAEKTAVKHYLGSSLRDMPWDLIRCALSSVAGLCILPMQDILGLDASARMNTPGTSSGNWGWRFCGEQMTNDKGAGLAELTRLYGRAPFSGE